MYDLKWKQPYVFIYLANSMKVSVKILCYEGTVSIKNKDSCIFGYLCDVNVEVEWLETLSSPLVKLCVVGLEDTSSCEELTLRSSER